MEEVKHHQEQPHHLKHFLENVVVDFQKKPAQPEQVAAAQSHTTAAAKTGQHQNAKPKPPAASLNSSTYSSAAGSSSSSTASDSSDASSTSSANSAASSPNQPARHQQSNASAALTSSKATRTCQHEQLELPKMEELGKTALIVDSSTIAHQRAQIALNNINTSSSLSSISSDNKQPATNHKKLNSSTSDHDRHASQSLSASTTTSSLTATVSATKLKSNRSTTQQLHNKPSPTFSSTSSSSNGPNAAAYTVTSATFLAAAAAAAVASSNTNINPSENWKTITAKRDKRRKKPVEKKLLAGQIPGNLGDSKTIDELVNFIQSSSSTNGQSNQNSNKTNKHKTTNNTGLSNKQVRPLHKMQSDNTSLTNNTNSTSTTSSTKSIAASLPPSPTIQPISTTTTSVTTTNNSPNIHNSQPQPSSLNQVKSDSHTQEPAVIFANHLRVKDDDANLYTFGFFDETSNVIKHEKAPVVKSPKDTSIVIKANNNSNIPKTSNCIVRKSTLSQNQRVHSDQQLKSKQKQTKPSLNSESCYKFKDNIDANSFNYHQILKFISSSWESTKAQMPAASNHN